MVSFLLSMVPATLAGAPTGVVADPAAFNPNKELSNVHYTIDEAVDSVTLNIYDPAGKLVASEYAGPQGPCSGSLTWSGMDNTGNIAPDGEYIAQIVTTRLPDQNTPPSYITQWGEEGSGENQISTAHGVAVSGDYVYVADSYNHRILQYDIDGNIEDIWGSKGTGDNQFNYPIGVAVSGDYVYVADTFNDRIVKYSTDGTFIKKWGTSGSGDEQFLLPYDVAVSNGYVYVADTFNDRIVKYDTEGTFIKTWGTRGSGDGQLIGPYGLAVSGDYVYVADTWNSRIMKFSTDGNFITQLGSEGSGDYQLYGPHDVAVSDGYVYVADSFNDRIVKYCTDDIFITKWGTEGTGENQLNYPFGVAVYGDYIYVADTENNRIVKYGYSPVMLSADTTVVVDTQAPEVNVIIPSDGASYTLGQSVLADWTATDAMSGVASSSGTVPGGSVIDTSSVGIKTFEVTATDNAGNTRTPVIVHYTVAYAYTPVTPSSSKVTQMKLGSSLPVKVQLKDYSGNLITNAVVNLYLAKQTSTGWGPEIPATSLSSPKDGNLLRYDPLSGQYLYNLNTKALSTGTWQLRIKMDDTTTKTMTIKLVK